MKKRHQQKLVILSITLWVLFNFPVLHIFSQEGDILGFPVAYFYLLLVGFLSVMISYLILYRHFE